MDIFSYFTSDIDSSKIGFDDDEFGDAEFGSLGIAFKFAEMEYTSKVRDLSDAASLYGTLSKVFFGLSATELDISDIYEDEEYDKRSVDVSLMDSSEVLHAYVYVWANNVDPDLYGKGRNSAYLP